MGHRAGRRAGEEAGRSAVGIGPGEARRVPPRVRPADRTLLRAQPGSVQLPDDAGDQGLALGVSAVEPYRVFFPVGVVAGLIGAGAWTAHALGWIGWPGPLHRGLMMPVFEMAFVLGFLLTSMPAFTHGPKCRPAELGWAVAALLVTFAATLLSWSAVADAASFAAVFV